jgi:hypothetical protein
MDTTRTTSTTSRARTTAAIIGAAALAGIAFVAGRGTAPSGPGIGHEGRVVPVPGTPAPGRTAGPDVGSAGPRGLRLVNGVPVGYPHTASGALSAAANYTAAFGSPAVLTAKGRAGLLTAVTVAGRNGQPRAQLDQAPKSAMLDGLARDQASGARFVLRAVPLTVRLAGPYDPATVHAQVYAATYVAGSENTATIGHGLAAVALVWRDGDWKLTSILNRPQVGPIPAGYVAPEDGWQPGTGNLVDVSEQVRDAMSGGAVPTYVVP